MSALRNENLIRRKLVNNSINAIIRREALRTARFLNWPKALLFLFSLASIPSLSGCGTDLTTKPQVGAITFTDINGVPVAAQTMLNAGSVIYLDAVVSNDKALLGVNWTVICSDQLPPGTPLPPGWDVDESCGFFTPAHTATGPVPSYATSSSGIVTFFQAPNGQPSSGTVTIYASATADPTRFSSVTLSIMP